MVKVGDRGDYCLVLVNRFEMVALNKKITVFGGGVRQSTSISDPHLVSNFSFRKMAFHVFKTIIYFLGYLAYCVRF